MPSYRNISFATVGVLSDLVDQGADVLVRGPARTKELLHQTNVLELPGERFLFVPGRSNDPFAQIAEAIWMIAGRSDVDWLSQYLPRAKDFSDDGTLWRAAYGPRLRRWHGKVDQLSEVRRLLLEDKSTRRAVMTLFDPEYDYVESKNIPCNNWLGWIIRDDRLHVDVALRSSDAVWGFSGANAFGWSVLHEMMAYWTESAMGQATFFATSFHIYERHYGVARRVAAGYHRCCPYDYDVPRAHFGTEFDRLNSTLERWFELETRVRTDPNALLDNDLILTDPFLFNCLQILRLKWGRESWDDATLSTEMEKLPETDALAAAYEYFGRKAPRLLENIPHPHIASFFDASRARVRDDSQAFLAAISSLHSRKDQAYGAAWKKRGERISILPNIARKVDRLESFANAGLEMPDETVLDTTIDLYVYATKYRLYLEEEEPSSSLLPAEAPTPYTEHETNFERLIYAARLSQNKLELLDCFRNVVEQFEILWPMVEGNAPLTERRELAEKLIAATWQLLEAIKTSAPEQVKRFVARENL